MPAISWLKRVIKLALRPYFKATANRRAGLAMELTFWDKRLNTYATAMTALYERLLDPNSMIQDEYRQFFDHIPKKTIEILDVGAGPLTKLGKNHPAKELRIVATDVLAAEYDDLLDKHGIEPPVRTTYAPAESLGEYFAENSFDFVIAINSLDHAANPLEGIKQMLHVVRENCYILLVGRENEAKHEAYRGLHQWNFFVKNEKFFIEGRCGSVDVSRDLAEIADCECERRKDVLRISFRKTQR